MLRVGEVVLGIGEDGESCIDIESRRRVGNSRNATETKSPKGGDRSFLVNKFLELLHACTAAALFEERREVRLDFGAAGDEVYCVCRESGPWLPALSHEGSVA